MDRCALFVDAGYLLADGAMAVHGTRNRDSVSWDYAGLVQLLNEVARDRTGLPLLRCYWYESTVEGRRSQEQDGIADIPGVKFRAARIRPGRREGVESYVQRDLTTLARTGVLCEAVLVSGDEDMTQVVADVQDMGVRVTVMHIAVEGNWTIARSLRRECDDLVEVGAGHLRPYVNLLSSAGAPQDGVAAPITNGRSRSPNNVMSRQPVAAHPEPGRVEPAAVDVMYANTGAQPATGGNAMEQLRAMRQSLAQGRGGDHLAPQGSNPPLETQPPNQPPPMDATGFPPGGRPPGAGGEVSPTTTHPDQSGNHVRPPMPHTGAHPSMAPNPPTGANPSLANPATGPHPSMRGGQQGGFNGPPQEQGPHPGMPPPGAHRDPGAGGGPPYERDAPPNSRGAPPGQDPRYGPNTGENPGFGGNTGPNPTIGASTEAENSLKGATTTQPAPRPATGPRPNHRVQHGPYTSPTPRVGYVASNSAGARNPEDAVNIAHREGSDFGESLVRDAPELWLEAVLAGRPRMPSDLEARLLQGSSLPIDFLLRDDVRDALRAGFWSALDRSRG